MTTDDAPDPLWEAPIVLAATPIGNLGDTTDRLRRLLETAEIIACEDTRRTRHLLQALQITATGRLVSLHEHNEASRAAELVQAAAAGTRVLVVSDAGMPAVSDPGYRLISAAVSAGVGVTVAPGASAVTTALALSGLPTDAFTFAGFFPRKAALRARLIERLRGEEWTIVLFESPHRIAATVAELAQQLGGRRQAAVARELTKRYEEVLRGSLSELAEELAGTAARGEYVLVLAGADAEPGHGEGPSVEELAVQVVDRAEAGERLKAAAKAVGAAHGVSASELFDAAVERRRARQSPPVD